MKEIKKYINKEMANIAKFTLKADNLLDKGIKSCNKELKEMIDNLQEKYNTFSLDKSNEKNLDELIHILSLSTKTFDKILDRKDKLINELVFKNKGIVTPLSNINGVITMYKQAGRNKDALCLYGRLEKATKEVCEYFLCYFIDGIDTNYCLLNNLVRLYGRETLDIVKENELADEIEIEIDEEEIEEVVKNKNEKLFSYRDMDNFMKENGFEIIRYNGDHCIYSNGSYSIPLPCRTIGKGLSMKIQSQVKNIA